MILIVYDDIQVAFQCDILGQLLVLVVYPPVFTIQDLLAFGNASKGFHLRHAEAVGESHQCELSMMLMI